MTDGKRTGFRLPRLPDRLRGAERALNAVWIAAPMAATLLLLPFIGPDTDDLNRRPVPLPRLAVETVWDGTFFSEAAGWLGERVPGRAEFRRVAARVNNGLFRDVDSAQIAKGREGWLFFRPALDAPFNAGFAPASGREGIVRLKELVEARGKTFRMVFAPHKPSVYPDYLIGHDRIRQRQARRHLEEFRAHLRLEPVAGFIDAWPAMSRAAANRRPDVIYHPRDTHWTAEGASIVSHALIESLEPGLFGQGTVSADRVIDYVPDLVRYAGLDKSEKIRAWRRTLPGVTVTRTHRVFERTTSIERYEASSDGPDLLPRLVVVHDSFGVLLRHSLSSFFQSVSYIHVNSASKPLAAELFAEADIVFVLFAERFLYASGPDLPVGPMSPLVLDLLQYTAGQKAPANDDP